MNSENDIQVNQEKDSIEENFLNKVTPLSKYLAMTLFIVLPFIGGWVGYRYAPDKVVEVDRVITVNIEKHNADNSLDESRFIEEISDIDDDNLFLVREIEVGDKFGELTVESIYFSSEPYTFDGTHDVTVRFSGEVVLTGNLFGPVMSCDLGIQLDSSSQNILPIFVETGNFVIQTLCIDGDDGGVQNIVDIIGQEKITEGKMVTIKVDDFVYYYAHKGGGPHASFVNLIE